MKGLMLRIRTLIALSTACLLMSCVPFPSGLSLRASTPPAFFGDVLTLHNRYRASHCARPLAWSAKLAQTAASLARRCEFRHSGRRLGENLGWGTAGRFTPAHFVRKWYGEVGSYDFGRGRSRDGREINHFTQIVWQGSQYVGCAWAKCGRYDYLVCNYAPRGNIIGRYRRQVRRC